MPDEKAVRTRWVRRQLAAARRLGDRDPGAVTDALRAAASRASRVRDHEGAVDLLAEALRWCEPSQAEPASELVEELARAARLAGAPEEGLRRLQDVEERLRDGPAAGQMHLARARLLSYGDDYHGRDAALLEAERAFARWGRIGGRVTALSELGFPGGRGFPLEERIRYGREGLTAAHQAGDPFAWAYCAGNLAASLFHAGDLSALSLLGEARERLDLSSTRDRVELVRQCLNLATYHLWLGKYRSARRPLREAAAIVDEPFWQTALGFVEGVLDWREGRWDQALPRLTAAAGDASVGFYRMATVIEAAIRFERGEAIDLVPVEAARAELQAKEEDFWGTLALGLCVQLRAAHRRPNPGRGVVPHVDAMRRIGLRVGSQDLLPAMATADASLYDRLAATLRDLHPPGRHADAYRAMAEGIRAAGTDTPGAAFDALKGAAEELADLGEPHAEARALEEASFVAPNARMAREAAQRSAEVYAALRASRSLARLVRTSRKHGRLTHQSVSGHPPARGAPGLTPREHEVARLAGLGYSAAEIAEQLVISTGTARKHLEHIKRKLGIAKKSELVRLINE